MTKREALTKALSARNALKLRSKGRSDWGNVDTAIRLAGTFLASYPVASDERVKEWAQRNSAWVRVLVPSNRPELLNTIMQ